MARKERRTYRHYWGGERADAYADSIRAATDAAIEAAKPLDQRVEQTHFALSRSLKEDPLYAPIRSKTKAIYPCLNNRHCVDFSSDNATMTVKPFLITEMLKKLSRDETTLALLLLHQHHLITEENAQAAFKERFGAPVSVDTAVSTDAALSSVDTDADDKDMLPEELLPEELPRKKGKPHDGLPIRNLNLPEHVSGVVFGREEALAGNHRWRRDPDAFDSGDEDPQATPWTERAVGAANRTRGPRSLFDRSIEGAQIDPDRYFGL